MAKYTRVADLIKVETFFNKIEKNVLKKKQISSLTHDKIFFFFLLDHYFVHLSKNILLTYFYLKNVSLP